AALLALDELHLVLGGRLGEEVVHAGFLGDELGRARVVARDHHGADAHAPEVGEALRNSGLDDVLEIDDAQRARRVGGALRGAGAGGPTAFGDDEGRAALGRYRVDRVADLGRDRPALLFDPPAYRVGRALADRAAVHVHTAHARLRSEWDEVGADELALAEAELLLGEYDDRAALGGLVGEARELGGVGELLVRHSVGGDEGIRLAVAERDRSRLVEHQGGAVACCLDGTAAHAE